MARLETINYEPIIAKYQTGMYSVNSLAKSFKIDEKSLRNYIKKHDIKINPMAQSAVDTLHQGLTDLSLIRKSELGDLPPQQADRITHLLQAEVIDIIKKRHPEFARSFNAIASLMLARSAEILQKENVTASEINQVSNAVKNINETLQVIPKPSAINQQINIETKQAKDNELEDKANNPITIDVKFIE